MKNIDLGSWAVLDIETTGIDASVDEIIDVGFLQFDGTELVKKYSSLVNFPYKISKFITALTGIDSKMVKKAPPYSEVEKEIQTLYGYKILAHNAGFEKNFLERSFKKIDDGEEREEFVDSMYFLSLLNPHFESLKLEKFISLFQIKEKEDHRGLEDSIDLLKVLLVSVLEAKKYRTEFYQYLCTSLANNNLQDWWYYKLLNQETENLYKIAKQIEFDPDLYIDLYLNDQALLDNNYNLEEVFDKKFSGENIKKIFESEEIIREKLFSEYVYRDSQKQMALKVGQSLSHKVHALVQAPTGTGKTLGYLVPSALYAYNNDEQILVATGTKTLQSQIIDKDLKALRNLLGMDDTVLKVTSLVGSNNHLCELKFRNLTESEGGLIRETHDFDESFTRSYFDSIFFHNSYKSYAQKVLALEIPYVLTRKNDSFNETLKDIKVDFRTCVGKKCPYVSNCSYIQGLKEAKESQIIIGNHALMFRWPRGFPRPLKVIVDEAHKIESEATNSFSNEVYESDFNFLIKSMTNLQGIGALFYLLTKTDLDNSQSEINEIREKNTEVLGILKEHFEALPSLIERYFKKQQRFSDYYWNEIIFSVDVFKREPLSNSILNTLSSIEFILKNYLEFLTTFYSRFEVTSIDDEQMILAYNRFDHFYNHLSDISEVLNLSINNSDKYAHSLKYHESQGFCLFSAPIDIGEVLHKQLLQTSDSVTFTSATLANSDGSQGVRGVEWMTGYSYLDAERRYKSGFFLPPVFDYKDRTRVFLCSDTPSIHSGEFVSKSLEHIIKLIKKIGGKSLLLYSSRVRFEEAREILLNEFSGKLPVFIQGMGTTVVEDFKNSKNGILIGMEAFSEGIDVPGEILQFLFIDKIPDLRMDKIIEKRREFFDKFIGNEFSDYYLANRTRSLHQKLGRLIRKQTDFGGAIIVDSRTKNWKNRTFQSLEKMMLPYELKTSSLETACDEMADFLSQFS